MLKNSANVKGLFLRMFFSDLYPFPHRNSFQKIAFIQSFLLSLMD